MQWTLPFCKLGSTATLLPSPSTTMGVEYALHCAACGYHNPHCCAGVEAGMAVTLSTVHCATCKQLYDVPVFEHGNGFTEIPLRCPRNKAHAVVAWSHPGPCPVCGQPISKLGQSAVWD